MDFVRFDDFGGFRQVGAVRMLECATEIRSGCVLLTQQSKGSA